MSEGTGKAVLSFPGHRPSAQPNSGLRYGVPIPALNPSPLTNASSLKALEWGSVCALLVRRAARSVNQEGFASFLPGGASQTEVVATLGQVEALRTLLEEGPLPFSGIPEVGDVCEALAIQGEYLDGAELVAVAVFATASSSLGRDVQSRLDRRTLPPSRFLSEAADLARIGELSFVRSVERAIGPKGEVRDDASPELRRLRARTSRLRDDLDLVFDTYLRDPKANEVLQDKVVASRNGRSAATTAKSGSEGRAKVRKSFTMRSRR